MYIFGMHLRIALHYENIAKISVEGVAERSMSRSDLSRTSDLFYKRLYRL